ncbi:MAG: heavy metal transporter [Nanoarchaeota archaeon]|nr:heavy metal transporter [Nanoarchaeota archaeon]
MVEIKAKGMHCKSCEMLIIDALEDAGIAATADFKKNIVTIDDPAKKDQAEKIIREEGY